MQSRKAPNFDICLHRTTSLTNHLAVRRAYWRSYCHAVGWILLTIGSIAWGPEIDRAAFAHICAVRGCLNVHICQYPSLPGKPDSSIIWFLPSFHNRSPLVELRLPIFNYEQPAEPCHPVPCKSSRRALVALFTSVCTTAQGISTYIAMSPSSALTSTVKQPSTMVGTTTAANAAKQAASKMHRRSRTGTDSPSTHHAGIRPAWTLN